MSHETQKNPEKAFSTKATMWIFLSCPNGARLFIEGYPKLC